MTKEATIKGYVTEVLPNTLFRVQTEDGREVIAYLAGKLRINRIRVMAGDTVTLVLSPDGEKARIIYRG